MCSFTQGKGFTMTDTWFIAVDPPETNLHEDGFFLAKNPEPGIGLRLSVATILPPLPPYKFSRDTLENNAYRVLGEPGNFHLFSSQKASAHSLNSHEPRAVICAVYEMREDGFFTETIQLTEGRAFCCTYEEFRRQKDFSKNKQSLEQFILQFPHIYYKYKNPSLHTNNWRNQVTEERVLTSALLALLNKTLSVYCQKVKLQTLIKSGFGLSFRIHNDAVFTGPLRKFEALVNVVNLHACLNDKPIPFTETEIRALGLEFQTT